jgi:hypothetical protein
MASLIDSLKSKRYLQSLNQTQDFFADRKQEIADFYLKEKRPALPFTVQRKEPGKIEIGI